LLAKKYEKPELSWLITASFHDMAYPVLLYDDGVVNFLTTLLGFLKEVAHVELKSNFVDKSLLVCLSYLLARLCSVFLKREASGNWLAERNDLVQQQLSEFLQALYWTASVSAINPCYKTISLPDELVTIWYSQFQTLDSETQQFLNFAAECAQQEFEK
jgi:hypothetical protein